MSVSWEDVYNACRDRIQTEVGDVESVQIQYDNSPFTLDELSLWNDCIWIRFKVIPGISLQADMGTNNTYRTPGVAMAVIFCLLDKGDQPILEMADIIKTAFRGISYSGVNFKTPYIGPPIREHKWWSATVHCPFYSDDQ